MSFTSIIILTHNQLEHTQRCIQSIRLYTTLGSYEIIVVDNASADGTIDWLKQQADITNIFNEENVGFPKGCNQGISRAKGDVIVLLNNDTIVTPRWLEKQLDALYSSEEIGAVGPVTNSASYYQAIPVNYKSVDELFAFSARYNEQPPRWEQRLKLVFFCVAIKRTALDAAGLLDEQFTPGNYEDDDFSLRLVQKGYKLLLCRNVFIHHFGSASFKKDRAAYQALLQQNNEKFVKKWGFSATYSLFIRQEILQYITDPQDKPLRVLEVGCACGATLLEIKNRYPQAQLHGIELNSAASAVARQICAVSAADVETASLEFPEEYFDYIIFADVLEHLRDPWNTLSRIRPLLAPEGHVLASLPNIMHHSIVSQLINGHWTYTNAGILDKTHLRFFTLQEMISLFKSSRYTTLQAKPVTLPLSQEETNFLQTLTETFGTTDIRQQYEAYQYIFKAQK